MMKNDAIINAWNEIESDDVTKNEILSDIIIRQRKQAKRLRKRKIAVIIAAVPITLLFLCAAAVIVYEYVFYDMDGNVQNIEPHAYSRYESGTEEYEFEEELRKNKEDNAIIFILYKEADTGQYPIANTIPAIKNIYDYDELKAYILNNGSEAFVLPDYIPAGFEFSSASISLTLPATADYEAFEPIYREEKFGNTYEKYLLPEEQTCAENIIVSYTNGKIYLSCIIRFSENSLVFGRSSELDKEPEVIDIPQFERSLIMSYKNGLINPNPMWTVLAERRMDEPVSILNTIFIGKSFRETYMNKLRTRKCRYVNYSIDSTSTLFSGVSRKEIIKVATSIK